MLSFTVHHGKLKSTKKPLPKLRPGWALIRVRMAGICNTDIEILRGYHNFRGTPGHEFVGEIADVAGVPLAIKRNWLGKRVAGEINVACKAYGHKPVCDFCRREVKSHCRRRTVLGIVAHDGAFAQYLVLPLENLHEIPANVKDEQAVFIEPLAAACRILEQLNRKEFPSAAVLGDGKLAQLIALVLHANKIKVVMYGKHANKLMLVQQAGISAQKVFGDSRDLRKVKEKYNLVVEATGSPTGLRLAEEITEPLGTLVLKSTFHGTAPVETWPIVVREIKVVGSRCGPFAKAIALLHARKINPAPLITRVFALEDAPKAIQFAQQSGVMKVLLVS